MIDPVALLAFLPVALALNLTPGADMLFCIGQGMRGGAAPAVAASAGISLGALVHTVIAALGLAAVLAAAPWLGTAIRWAGAGYLLWLAWSALRGPADAGAPAAPPLLPRQAFVQGLAINLANPKVIFFVLALLPGFVTPERPALPQFLLLGAILGLGGFVVNALAGTFAARAASTLARGSAAALWMQRISGGIFALLAVGLLLPKRI